jgi:hypothetical protein
MVQGDDADQNDSTYNGQFAAWPVGHKDQRVERLGGGWGSHLSKIDWEMSQYPHGTVVAWEVRAYDGHDYSAWTKPCYVKVDAERPVAPAVTSTDYPSDGQQHGGEGVPGTFTLSANGSSDVVGYYWGMWGEANRYIPAPSPGASVELDFTPTSFSNSLSFQAIDAAGNRSETVHYDFLVRSTAPAVDVTLGGVGLPSRVKIWTDLEEVTEFGYAIGDGAEVRVPADEDGRAEVSVVFPQAGLNTIRVRSYAGTRLVGGYTDTIYVNDYPFIESDDFSYDKDGVVGQPGQFTFRPGRPGVVAYEWAVNQDELRRIEARADHTAVLDWTPTEGGWTTLWVRSISADGTVTDAQQYEFNVIDHRPYVWSNDYDEHEARGGVGIASEFHFASAADIDLFVYQLNGRPEQTIEPFGGAAEVALAPDRSGNNTLTVRARYTDGTFSPARDFVFLVSDAPIVVSTDYPANQRAGQQGQAGSFTFHPGRPDLVEYRYTTEYGGEEHVVAAGADGRATVDITPMHPGYNELVVTGRTVDGTATAERRYQFQVRDNRISVNSAYGDWQEMGGIGAVGVFTVYSDLDEVTTIEYQVNGGAWRSLPRPASNSIEISLTMDRNGENLLSVRGRTASGELTPQTDYPFRVGTEPLVTSSTYPQNGEGGGIGVPGDFTITRGSPGVVEFEYAFDSGETTTIAADAAGVATITYTPTYAYYHYLTVRGRTADGEWTHTATYQFFVSY